MASLLSNLLGNFAGGIQKIKCKDSNFFLEYKIVNDNLVKYKYISWSKNYSNKIDKNLKSYSKII